MDHGFFAVNVFACFHGVDGYLLVPVVRGADDDRVDVFALKNLGVVDPTEANVPDIGGTGNGPAAD